MIAGYDIDGVLCAEPGKLDRFLYRLLGRVWAWPRAYSKRLIWQPRVPGYCLVSGRPKCDMWVTKAWLRRVGIAHDVALVVHAPAVGDGPMTKAKAIVENRLALFYESSRAESEEVVKILLSQGLTARVYHGVICGGQLLHEVTCYGFEKE